MKHRLYVVIIVVVATMSACHKDKSRNSALDQDLNLANQRDSSARFDSLSAAERGNAPNASATPSAATTHERSSSTAPAREPVSHARRSGSAGSGGASSPSSAASTPAASTPSSGGTTVQRNTKRDAAIGAGAGAVVGGVTHGLKGGVIGAVVGGVVGGVIGNNVDIKKKKKKNP